MKKFVCDVCDEKEGISCGKVHTDGRSVRSVFHKRDDKGCYVGECLDQVPLALPVGFRRPPSLAELVNARVNQAMRAMMDDDPGSIPEDLDEPFEEADFYSPHELVHDAPLGREITKAEKVFIDAQRRSFDEAYVKFKRQRLAEKASAPVSAPAPAPGGK